MAAGNLAQISIPQSLNLGLRHPASEHMVKQIPRYTMSSPPLTFYPSAADELLGRHPVPILRGESLSNADTVSIIKHDSRFVKWLCLQN